MGLLIPSIVSLCMMGRKQAILLQDRPKGSPEDGGKKGIQKPKQHQSVLFSSTVQILSSREAQMRQKTSSNEVRRNKTLVGKYKNLLLALATPQTQHALMQIDVQSITAPAPVLKKQPPN